MHELGVTKLIAQTVIDEARKVEAHRIVEVHLIAGAMRHLEQEWVQYYFDRFSKGSVAQDAQIVLEETPIVNECQACFELYSPNLEDGHSHECPHCKSASIRRISGGELIIKQIVWE